VRVPACDDFLVARVGESRLGWVVFIFSLAFFGQQSWSQIEPWSLRTQKLGAPSRGAPIGTYETSLALG